MAFDPNTFTPVYETDDAPKTKQPKGDVASEGKSSNFDPENFKLVAPSDDAVQTNWWTKFSEGMMDAIDTFNYQVGTGARGTMQLLLPESAEKALKLDEQQAISEKDAQEARKRSPNAALAGDIVGIGADITNKVAQGGGIGAGFTKLLPGAAAAIQGLSGASGIAANLAKGALGGAGAAAATYAKTDEDKLDNMATGAGIGAGLAGAGSLLSKGLSSALNRPVDEATEILEKGKGTVGQVLNRPNIQKVEEVLAKFPVVGTKGKFIEQGKNLDDLTKQFADKIGKAPSSSLAAKAPSDPAEAAAYYIQQAGDDLSIKADSLYRKFDQLAGKSKNMVDITTTQKKASQLLEQQDSLFPLAGGDEIAKVAKTLSEQKAINPSSLQRAKQFIDSAYETVSKSSPQAARPLLNLRNSLQADIRNFANKQGGEIAKAYRAADDFYSSSVIPFKQNKIIDKVLNGKVEPAKIMSEIIKPNQPEVLRGVMKNLSQEGRASIRNSIVNTLHEAATKDNRFNPITFSHSLEKTMTTMKGALNKEQFMELKGLKKLYDIAKPGLAQANKSSPAGAFATLAATAYGYVSFPIASSLLGGATAVSKLLTSPKTSKMLIDLAGTKSAVGSKKVITKLLSTLNAKSDSDNNESAEPDYRIK